MSPSLFFLGPDFSDDACCDFSSDDDFPGIRFLEMIGRAAGGENRETIIRGVRQGARESRRVHTILEAAGIGLWQQRSNQLCLSGAWYHLFGIPVGEIFILDEYLELIDDPADCRRVAKSRGKLPQEPYQTRWSDTFSLAGKKVRSKAIVWTHETVLGVDVLV